MPNIEWKYLKTPLSKEDIVKVEKQIGFVLPTDFVKLVMKHNGGRPRPNRFNTNDSSDRVLKSLISLNPNDPGNFYSVLEWVGGRLQRSLVPIAEDPAGNYLCFDFSSTKPCLVFWNNENGTIEFVCNGFVDLLDKLH
jgi:cell wall assembly regulator SMI1